jgi:hypothetical protein
MSNQITYMGDRACFDLSCCSSTHDQPAVRVPKAARMAGHAPSLYESLDCEQIGPNISLQASIVDRGDRARSIGMEGAGCHKTASTAAEHLYKEAVASRTSSSPMLLGDAPS